MKFNLSFIISIFAVIIGVNRDDHPTSEASSTSFSLFKSWNQNERNIVMNGNTTHGHATKGISPTYHSWSGMKARCTNPKHQAYKNYGGKGIIICERWLNSFQNFLEDMGIKPQGLTIDRINNNGNYEPSNCRWATRKEQTRNYSRNKLCADDIVRIKEIYRPRVMSYRKIAELYNVHEKTIALIMRGKIWT